MLKIRLIAGNYGWMMTEIIPIEIKGLNRNSTWEIVGIYRAPNEDLRAVERLAARTGYTGNCTKRSIIGGDL